MKTPIDARRIIDRANMVEGFVAALRMLPDRDEAMTVMAQLCTAFQTEFATEMTGLRSDARAEVRAKVRRPHLAVVEGGAS